MKSIYRAKDITEAYIISGLLESYGIESHVGGYYLQGGVGEIASMDFATINVAEEDVDAAILIISEYEDNSAPSIETEVANKNRLTAPLIIIFIVLMLLLAIAFSD